MQSHKRRVFSIKRAPPIGVPLASLAPALGTAPATSALRAEKGGREG